MEKINIHLLQSNLPSEDDIVPYSDIEMIAEKLNEVIDYINSKKDQLL